MVQWEPARLGLLHNVLPARAELALAELRKVLLGPFRL
jgi:hypothetical protein